MGEDILPSLAEIEAQKSNQAKFIGNLKSISLKESGSREFTVTLNESTADTKGQIHRLILLLEEQQFGNMTFCIPKQIENKQVIEWECVTFETRITKWTRTDKLTLSGLVTKECLLAMNDVIHNWKEDLEFFFEGHQQTID